VDNVMRGVKNLPYNPAANVGLVSRGLAANAN
jgi:hypothetical protein